MNIELYTMGVKPFLIFFLSALMLAQAIFLKNIFFGYVLTLCETVVIMRFLLENKLLDGLYWLTLFGITSFDDLSFFNLESFHVYNITNFPRIGGIAFVFLSLFLFILILNKYSCTLFDGIKNKNKIICFGVYMLISGVSGGLLFGLFNGFFYDAIVKDLSQLILPAIYMLMFYVSCMDFFFF